MKLNGGHRQNGRGVFQLNFIYKKWGWLDLAHELSLADRKMLQLQQFTGQAGDLTVKLL